MADDNQTVEDGNDSDSLKNLRQAAEAGRKAQREVAFLKAGVDTDSPIGKLLFKSYDGDLDIEAIKASALEVGAIKAPAAPAQDTGPTAEELAQTAMRNDLASNSGTPSNTEANPYDEALAAFDQARREGATAAQRSAAALGPVFAAASRGDRRVLG